MGVPVAVEVKAAAVVAQVVWVVGAVAEVAGPAHFWAVEGQVVMVVPVVLAVQAATAAPVVQEVMAAAVVVPLNCSPWAG